MIIHHDQVTEAAAVEEAPAASVVSQESPQPPLELQSEAANPDAQEYSPAIPSTPVSREAPKAARTLDDPEAQPQKREPQIVAPSPKSTPATDQSQPETPEEAMRILTGTEEK